MLLGKGFKSSKCKTLLKMAMSRVKLLRNKRLIQVKQMRQDIAQLLGAGQEACAAIRVEHVIREQNIIDAYDMIELYAELIVVRLAIISGQKTCPADLKEAISTLMFAAPRCADLPELADVKAQFTLKYGKDFVAAATELRVSSGVNRRFIEKMSTRAPDGETKLKVLKQVAIEYKVDWNPANTEAELLSQPEDLLDGPQKFVAASNFGVNNYKPVEAPAMQAKPPSRSPSQSPSRSPRRSKSSPLSRNKSSPAPRSVLQDVAAAAEAAAESAEHAAAAARAVASLALREQLNVPLRDSVPHSGSHKLRDYISGPDDDELYARFRALQERRYS